VLTNFETHDNQRLIQVPDHAEVRAAGALDFGVGAPSINIEGKKGTFCIFCKKYNVSIPF
jgi:hypothetical protein